MVQLTPVLNKLIPKWFNYRHKRVFLRRQNMFQLTYSQPGRSRNCWKRAQQVFFTKLKKEVEKNGEFARHMRELNSQRIIASCDELNIRFGDFIQRLPMLGIELDRKSLSNLAIWEPRTFESLVEIAKKYDPENYDLKN